MADRSVVVQLRVSASQFNSGIAQAQSGLRNLSASASTATGDLNAAIGSLSRLAAEGQQAAKILAGPASQVEHLAKESGKSVEEVRRELQEMVKAAEKAGVGVEKATAQAQKSADKTTSAFGDMAKKAAAGLAAIGFGAFVKDAIGAASDLQQNVGGVEAVFKDQAQAVKDFGETTADSVGIAKQEYFGLASLIGSQLKNAGVAMDQLAPQTNNLIGLAADLSAQFGGSAAEAVEALSSALKGEKDPIEKYGITLKQVDIDARAAAKGISQASATIELIGEQAADSTGAFAREADSFSGSAQRLSAKFEEVKASIGGPLLDVAGSFMGILSAGLPVLEAVGGALSGVISFINNLPGPIKAAVVGFAAFQILARSGVFTAIGSGFALIRKEAILLARQQSYLVATQGLSNMAAGAAVAGSRLKSLGKIATAGLGPLGLVIALVAAGMSFFTGKADAAAKAVEEQKSRVDELSNSLNRVTGELESAGEAMLLKAVSEIDPAQLSAIGVSAGEVGSALTTMDTDGGAAVLALRQKIADGFDTSSLKDLIDGADFNRLTYGMGRLGITFDDVAKKVIAGGPALDDLRTQLIGTGLDAATVDQIFGQVTGAFNTVAPAGGKVIMMSNDLSLALRGNAEALKTTLDSIAQGLTGLDDATKADLAGNINNAFKSLQENGGSAEGALRAVGIEGANAKAIIDAMVDKKLLQDAGDGTHKLADSVSAVATAAEQAETTMTGFKDVVGALKAPYDDLKAAIDFVNEGIYKQMGLMDELAAKQGDAEAAIRNAARAEIETAAGKDQLAEANAKVAESEAKLAEVRGDTTKVQDAERALNELRASGKASADQITEAEGNVKKARDEGNATAADVAAAERQVAEAKRGVSEVTLQNKDDEDKLTESRAAAKKANVDLVTSTILNSAATKDLSRSLADGNSKQRELYDEAFRSARAMGKSEEEARKYATALVGVPGSVSTKFKAEIAEAEKKGLHLVRVYDDATGTWSAKFQTQGEIESARAAGAVVEVYNRADGTFSATLTVNDQGSGQADRFLEKMRNLNGLRVYTNIVTNEQRIVTQTGQVGRWTGGMAGYAGGGSPFHGVLPGTPPANSKRDNLLGVLENGNPIAVRSREFIVNERATKKNLKALWYINGGGQIPGFASGGMPSAFSLAGNSPRSLGDRESNVTDALGDLRDALMEMGDQMREKAADARESFGKWREAIGDAKEAAREQAAKVKEARGEYNAARREQSSADKKAAAARTKAENDVNKVANLRAQLAVTSDKKARAAIEAQIKAGDKAAKASAKASDAADKAAAKAKTKTGKERGDLNKAKSAETAANRAQDAKVKAADKERRNDAARAAQAARNNTAAQRAYKAQEKARDLLVTQARQLDTVNNRLAAAQDKLKGLRDDKANLKSSIAGGLQNFGGDITQNSEQRTDAGSILKGLQYKNKNLGAFASNASRAASLGLNAKILEELAKAGDGGASTLAALAKGSKGQIAAINREYAKTGTLANQVGGLVANKTYDSQIAATARNVTTLTRQQVSLQRSLSGLARGVEGAVSKAMSGWQIKMDGNGVMKLYDAAKKQRDRR